MTQPLLAILALTLITPLSALAADKPDKASAQTELNLYATAIEAWQILQKDDKALLIDVRDPVEIKFTGFASATDIHVPWKVAATERWMDKHASWGMKANPNFEAELSAKLAELNADKNTTLIVMCRSGSTRSAPVVNLLASKGYTQAWTVVDGFEGSKLKQGNSKGVRAVDGWRNSGLPWGYKIDPAIAWQPAVQ